MNEVLQFKGNNTFEWTIGNFGVNKQHRSPMFQVDGRYYIIRGSSFISNFTSKEYWQFWINQKVIDYSIFPLYYTLSVVDHIGQDFIQIEAIVKGKQLHQRLIPLLEKNLLEQNNLIQNGILTLRFTFKQNWDGRKEPGLHTAVDDVTRKVPPRPDTKDSSTNTASSSGVIDDVSQKVSPLPPTKDSSTNTDGESSNFLETLSKDLECFYECNKNTDCVLRTGEIQFPVHRAVLSARSPIFSAMFHHDTAENRSGEVDIPDVDAITLKDVLYYVYSGKIRGLTAQTAASIYTVADKYGLIELRTECLDFLKCNLSIENIGDAALLAHIHGETELEERVIQLIEVRIKEVIESDQWREFSTMKPLLANKIFGIALVACRNKLVEKKP